MSIYTNKSAGERDYFPCARLFHYHIPSIGIIVNYNIIRLNRTAVMNAKCVSGETVEHILELYAHRLNL